MVGSPTMGRRRDAKSDATGLGEFEGIGQQVLEHLLKPFGIGNNAAIEMAIELDVEGKMAPLRLVPEWARNRFYQIGEIDLLRIHADRARLDLGQIQNIADEIHQIGASAVNG